MKNFPVGTRLATALATIALLGACSSDNDEGFSFKSDPPASYARVDRTGQPAIATALLSRDPAIPATGPMGGTLNPGNAANNFNNQRDALNRGDPINDPRDFAGLFTVGPQSNTLRNIHFEVGPALRALGLTTCSTQSATPATSNTEVDISRCVAQAAPVILPDVITYDLGAPNGWPNGRGYDDPVVDRLLAAALLDISSSPAPHGINTLVGIINTTADEAGTVLPLAFPHLRPRQP